VYNELKRMWKVLSVACIEKMSHKLPGGNKKITKELNTAIHWAEILTQDLLNIQMACNQPTYWVH
jgi:hypothetical protein